MFTSTEAVPSSSGGIRDDPSVEKSDGNDIVNIPSDIPSLNYYELYLSERSKNEELQRKMELMQEDQKKFSGIAQKCIDNLLLLM